MKKLVAIALSAFFLLSGCAAAADGSSQLPAQEKPTEAMGITTPDIPLVPAENNTEVPMLTREEAIEKALSDAGLSMQDVRFLEAELDRERSGLFWEVEFDYGNLEYSYDINAQTGEVVRVEQDRE